MSTDHDDRRTAASPGPVESYSQIRTNHFPGPPPRCPSGGGGHDPDVGLEPGIDLVMRVELAAEPGHAGFRSNGEAGQVDARLGGDEDREVARAVVDVDYVSERQVRHRCLGDRRDHAYQASFGGLVDCAGG